ncbi:MAG: hypothetical protein JXR34_03925 [Bacteroidales bacterium]|nr:hypothetical protein [Bacteroidales bacterium]
MLKRLTITILALIPMAFLVGQSRINSPYSRFGLGDIYKNEPTLSRSMGGIGYGIQSSDYVNAKNPASYVGLDSSSFLIDVGYSGFFMSNQTTNQIHSFNYFNIDYMRVAFPITDWWKVSFGLSPYSMVGYETETASILDSVGTIYNNYSGDGGVNSLTIGNGFKIFDGLSFGFNTSYLFGKLNYTQITSIPDNTNFYQFRLTNTLDIRNLYFDFGLQYKSHPFKNKDYTLVLGAVFSNQQKLRSNISTFGETYLLTSSGYEYIKDTIVNTLDERGKTVIPMFYGGGFNLQMTDKWSVGFDFSQQFWSNYQSLYQTDTLKNSLSMNLGGSYKIGRMTLRAGARYYDSYLSLNDNAIKELGMTFGLSVPLFIDQQSKSYPMLDLGAEIGKRGTTDNNLIQQNYVRVFIGLSIKSIWFNRPKYY